MNPITIDKISTDYLITDLPYQVEVLMIIQLVSIFVFCNMFQIFPGHPENKKINIYQSQYIMYKTFFRIDHKKVQDNQKFEFTTNFFLRHIIFSNRLNSSPFLLPTCFFFFIYFLVYFKHYPLFFPATNMFFFHTFQSILNTPLLLVSVRNYIP